MARLHAYRAACAIGLGLLVIGVAMWSMPAALVVAGVSLVLAGMAGLGLDQGGAA